jgi:hypothetical protein
MLEIAGNTTVEVGGMSWLKGEKKVLPTGALSAQVSCAEHNNQASKFDDAVTKVFGALRSFESGAWEGTDSTVSLVSGRDLERGMLKMLLCLGASSWMSGSREVVRIPRGDPALVQMIYRGRAMAKFPGLHLLRLRGARRANDSIESCLLFDTSDPQAVVGLSLTLIGFAFVLTLQPLRPEGSDAFPYEEVWRRPSQLTLLQGDCEKSLLLSWPGDYERDDDDSPIIGERVTPSKRPDV